MNTEEKARLGIPAKDKTDNTASGRMNEITKVAKALHSAGLALFGASFPKEMVLESLVADQGADKNRIPPSLLQEIISN